MTYSESLRMCEHGVAKDPNPDRVPGAWPPEFKKNLFSTSSASLKFEEVEVGDHYISAEIKSADFGVDIFVASSADNSWVGFRNGAFKAQFITQDGSYYPFVDGFDFVGNNFFSVSIREGFLVVSDGVTTKTLTDSGIGSQSNYTQVGGRGGVTSNVELGEVVLYDLADSTNSSVFSSTGSVVVDKVGTRSITQQPVEFSTGKLRYNFDYNYFYPTAEDIKSKYVAEAGNPITDITTGNIGESFAFSGAGWLLTYIEGYKKSGDTFWIDEAAAGINHMFNYTDKERFDRGEITCSIAGGDEYTDAPKYYLINDGVPANGWRRSFGGWSLSVLVNGVILSAIADVADLIFTDWSLSSHAEDANQWLSKFPGIIDEHDTSWSETKNSSIDGSWFFVNPTNDYTDDRGLYSNPLGFNHSFKMLSAMAIYNKYNAVQLYSDRIETFMQFFRRHLFTAGGFNCWWYAYDVGGNTKTEDVNHGGYDIKSLVTLNITGHIGYVETKGYCEIITELPPFGRSGLLHYRLDGADGGLASDTIASSADNLGIATEWSSANQYNSKMQELQRRAVSVILSQSNRQTSYWAVYNSLLSVL